MTQVLYRLRPGDRFLDYEMVKEPQADGSMARRFIRGDGPELAREAVQAAGLRSAWFVAAVGAQDVGEAVLNIPSGLLSVSTDEADRLAQAQQAALRSMDNIIAVHNGAPRSIEDLEAVDVHSEAGASLLLLRGRRPPRFEPGNSVDVFLRTSATIRVETEDVEVPQRFWAVIEVDATPHNWSMDVVPRPFSFSYRMIYAVPDTGALRVPNIHPSLSKSICFAATLDFLLACLDLSDEPLPDPMGAMAFLLQAHRHGLPAGAVPGLFGPDGNGRKLTFSDRLLGAMASATSSDMSGNPPAPRLIKTSTEGEAYAAEFMRYLGFSDACQTAAGVDGGIDVLSAHAFAQVKMEALPTGRPVIQAIHGVASLEEKSALVFSVAGFTTQAAAWADRAGVACFEFARDGGIQPVSQAARVLLRRAPVPHDSS